jgi:hypothetical protein
MIDFRKYHAGLEKIVSTIDELSDAELENFYVGLLKDNLNHASSNHIATFRFNQDGTPSTKFGKGLSSITVDMEYSFQQEHQYKYILRSERHNITVVTFPCSVHKVDQAYLTVTLDRPHYRVVALGRKINLDSNKHPEFFLTEDELSYAYLLGEHPLVGLPQYCKLLHPLVKFVASACEVVERRNATAIAKRKATERGMFYRGAYYFK